ncbi:MAG TPA: hypothetical protein VIV14_09445 [Gammaproteobacteria bacterium]
MRKLSTPLMLAACLSLVALQMSGLHMHVNADGFAGTPQGTHVHDAHRHDGTPAPHDHGHDHGAGQGHSSDTDVSIVNYNAGASKLPLDLIALALVLLMFVRPAAKLAPVSVVPRPLERYERWRPPNRAPPLPIS